MHMNSIVEYHDALTDTRELSAAEQGPRPADLGVDITGTREHRIVHARGELRGSGGELLVALVGTLLGEGCRRVRLDLAQVDTADLDGMMSLRHLRSMLTRAGGTLWVSHQSSVRLRTSAVGPAR
jgi:anti-anti-sigma regulatory factor